MGKKILEIVKKLNVVMDGKQKALAAVVLICSVLAAGLEVLGVSVILPLINALLTPDDILNNRIMGWLANLFGVDEYIEIIILVVAAVSVVYVIKNVYLIFFTWLKVRYSFKIQRETALKVLKEYINKGESD